MKYFKYIGNPKEIEIYRVYPDDKWEFYNVRNRVWCSETYFKMDNAWPWPEYYKKYSNIIKPITKAQAFIEIL